MAFAVVFAAGGSNDMQRNIVGDRVLGLPRQHSVEPDIPFEQVMCDQGKV